MDTFANRIIGWKASTTQDTPFVLYALEQAIHARRPAEKLIHHSDHRSQYVSIKHTKHLIDAGLEQSVGSVRDSCDNALVEWETLQWVDWFSKERLLRPLG
ncbi:DDE-type integrase/transposase/recombinase [Epibacterium ulvae]|uniref:DDE-type integrase/transposase/recombinase n=1 Tax=Epibacterium ulvae TaxID=1156985 RepID=UPI003CD0CEE6